MNRYCAAAAGNMFSSVFLSCVPAPSSCCRQENTLKFAAREIWCFPERAGLAINRAIRLKNKHLLRR